MNKTEDTEGSRDISALWDALHRTRYLALAGKCLYAGLVEEAAAFVDIGKQYKSRFNEDISLSAIEEIVQLVQHLCGKHTFLRGHDAELKTFISKRFAEQPGGQLIDGREMFEIVMQSVSDYLRSTTSVTQLTEKTSSRKSESQPSEYSDDSQQCVRNLWDKLSSIRPVYFLVDHEIESVVVFRRGETLGDCYKSLANEYDRAGMFNEAEEVRALSEEMRPYESAILDSEANASVLAGDWVVSIAEKIVTALSDPKESFAQSSPSAKTLNSKRRTRVERANSKTST